MIACYCVNVCVCACTYVHMRVLGGDVRKICRNQFLPPVGFRYGAQAAGLTGSTLTNWATLSAQGDWVLVGLLCFSLQILRIR